MESHLENWFRLLPVRIIRRGQVRWRHSPLGLSCPQELLAYGMIRFVPSSLVLLSYPGRRTLHLVPARPGGGQALFYKPGEKLQKTALKFPQTLHCQPLRNNDERAGFVGINSVMTLSFGFVEIGSQFVSPADLQLETCPLPSII